MLRLVAAKAEYSHSEQLTTIARGIDCNIRRELNNFDQPGLQMSPVRVWASESK